MFNLTQFEPTIIKLAKTYRIEPLEWQDIAQELRLHLWLKRDKFDPKKASYENWAYITCKNKIKDLARYYKREKRAIKEVSLESLRGENGEYRI